MARNTSGDFRETWELVKTLAWACVIAIGIRTFAFEPFNIPSGSMIPTLLIGDYLFVSKTAYGYSRYSFPWGLAPFDGRVWRGTPKRGEVIVFRPPGEPGTDFIKRLIGLPGDRIQVINGVLNINGQAVKRERIEDYVDLEQPGAQGVPQYMETLPEGVVHRIREEQGDNGQLDNTPVYVVPAGHYFMMGDNRDNSNDSRVPKFGAQLTTKDEITDPAMLDKVGFVPEANLIGPAKILFWSYDSSFRWYNPLTWATALRWQRLLNFIN
jgi:signal peptidase I